MRKVVRLNESDLNKIVEESVKQIIKENPNNEGLRNLWRYTVGNTMNAAKNAGRQFAQDIKQGRRDYRQYNRFNQEMAQRQKIAKQISSIIPTIRYISRQYPDEVDLDFMNSVEDYFYQIADRFSTKSNNFDNYRNNGYSFGNDRMQSFYSKRDEYNRNQNYNQGDNNYSNTNVLDDDEPQQNYQQSQSQSNQPQQQDYQVEPIQDTQVEPQQQQYSQEQPQQEQPNNQSQQQAKTKKGNAYLNRKKKAKNKSLSKHSQKRPR